MLYEVLLPNRLSHPFIYRVPEEMAAEAAAGKRVLVPLGSRKVIGSLYQRSSASPPKGLKAIEEILDTEPLLSSLQLKMIDFAAKYYLTPIGEVFRHFLPLPLLKRKNLPKERKLPLPKADPDYSLPPLTPEQEKVFQKILQERKNSLLHGITGSGKTEIYIHLARRVLEEGGGVLVLLPEIGLTPQIVQRFAHSISLPVVIYHSRLTEGERAHAWRLCHQGEGRLVIGTRSALFLPLKNLKLIVVDEEHDSSFKQEERFCYHARDLALWRGQEEGALVVLGSATPSLESRHRARMGKLELLSLTERPTGVPLPPMELIDLRQQPPEKSSLSPPLLAALGENLKKKEQSLLFLNRRGYAPTLICSRCGFSPRCDGCGITLAWHKEGGKLLCHYCDHSLPFTPRCPHCQGTPWLPQGAGTERIVEEVKKHFPHARLARLDRDVTSRKGWEEVLDRMRHREIDILVGTQIITKGHDYPHLTLVGIVNADVALHLPDFRATERAWQIVMQAAGRAGRKDRPGRVLIQTFSPHHPLFQSLLSGRETNFIENELQERERAGYPPFRRLIQIRFSGRRDRVLAAAEKGEEVLKSLRPLAEILGPAPCPIEKVRGETRWHLLLKTAQFTRLHPHLERRLDELVRGGLPSGVRMLVNVDPIDMM